MKLTDAIDLSKVNPPKKYKVVDARYGDLVSSHDTYEEAFQAAQARPYSKVIVGEIDTPEIRKVKRENSVVKNTDLLR